VVENKEKLIHLLDSIQYSTCSLILLLLRVIFSDILEQDYLDTNNIIVASLTDTNKSITYNLVAIIVHLGDAFGGHYIVYKRLLELPPNSNEDNITSNGLTLGNDINASSGSNGFTGKSSIPARNTSPGGINNNSSHNGVNGKISAHGGSDSNSISPGNNTHNSSGHYGSNGKISARGGNEIHNSTGNGLNGKSSPHSGNDNITHSKTRVSNGMQLRNDWVLISDSHWEIVPESTVLQQKAYLLFYEKR